MHFFQSISDKKNIVFVAFILAFITLMPAESPDMANYVFFYEESCQQNINQFLLTAAKEPIFSSVVYLFGEITSCGFQKNYRFILAFIGLLLTGLGVFDICKVFVNHSKSTLITISVLLFPILLEGSAHLVRQMWALGICLLLISYSRFSLLLVGSGIHLTALLFLPLLINRRKIISLVFFGILSMIAYQLLSSQYEISQLTYIRLIGLTESLSDVQLSELSVFSYLTIILTLVYSTKLYLKYYKSTPAIQLQTASRLLTYVILVAMIIIISIVLNYSEMSVRMMYFLYPALIIASGIYISAFGKTIFNIFSVIQIAIFIAIYYLRNFL